MEEDPTCLQWTPSERCSRFYKPRTRFIPSRSGDDFDRGQLAYEYHQQGLAWAEIAHFLAVNERTAKRFAVEYSYEKEGDDFVRRVRERREK